MLLLCSKNSYFCITFDIMFLFSVSNATVTCICPTYLTMYCDHTHHASFCITIIIRGAPIENTLYNLVQKSKYCYFTPC